MFSSVNILMQTFSATLMVGFFMLCSDSKKEYFWCKLYDEFYENMDMSTVNRGDGGKMMCKLHHRYIPT